MSNCSWGGSGWNDNNVRDGAGQQQNNASAYSTHPQAYEQLIMGWMQVCLLQQRV